MVMLTFWLVYHNFYSGIGSGCGSVCKTVVSDNRDPPFESSHQNILFAINCIKTVFKRKKIKKKRPQRANLKTRYWDRVQVDVRYLPRNTGWRRPRSGRATRWSTWDRVVTWATVIYSGLISPPLDEAICLENKFLHLKLQTYLWRDIF